MAPLQRAALFRSHLLAHDTPRETSRKEVRSCRHAGHLFRPSINGYEMAGQQGRVTKDEAEIKQQRYGLHRSTSRGRFIAYGRCSLALLAQMLSRIPREHGLGLMRITPSLALEDVSLAHRIKTRRPTLAFSQT